MSDPPADAETRDTRVGYGDTEAAGETGKTADDPAARKVDQLAIVERHHYELLGEFGRGGLGRVLRARDRRIGRIVAIKEALRSSPALLARFAREAVVTANLQHPSIVPVYEVGRWAPADEPFYAMKLVAGRTLADAMRGAKTLRDRLALLPHVVAVADALAYAHGEHVIHRDLKPANVLVGDFGETVVIDWGLAKHLGTAELAADADAQVPDGATVAGAVLGTPGYMPPEQARGELADERVDVYAIGAMLYELLSRVRPYADSDGANAVVARTAIEPPKPLAELEPELPRELNAIVLRAMAFDPAARYPTAKELADDLKRFTTGQLVGAQQYTAWMLIKRWLRRHRAIALVALAAIVVIAGVAAVSIASIQRARDRAVAARGLAEDRAAALAEEQGRQLEVTGDAARALPFLADAIARGRRSAALDFTLARALDGVAGVEAVLVGARGPVNDLAYSPDGRYLAASGDDFEIRIWDVHAHSLARTAGNGIEVAWSPDGRYLATVTSHDELVLRDPATGAALATFPPPPGDAAVAIAISPDSAVIGCGGREGTIAWYRADRSAPPVVHKAHAGIVHRVVFSRDSHRMAVASLDHTATVWDVTTGAQLGALHLGESVRDVTFSPDGSTLVVGVADGTLTAWDIATGRQLRAFVGHTNSVESVHFDPSGAHVVSGSADHTIIVWDAATGARLSSFDVGAPVLEATYSRDGAMIAVRTEHGNVALLTATAVPLELMTGHVGSIGDLRFSPDGTQLATAGLDGDVRLWRTNGAHAVTELDTARSVTWRGTWSPDGARIAVASKDGIVRLYDGATGALAHASTGHTGEVTWVGFSPDGKRLASASADGAAILWDAATGAKLGAIVAGAARVRWVGFSPDGARLGTTHDDGTARLWDATTLAPIAVMRPRGKPRRILWSSDGARLLVPDDGSGASLWDPNGKSIATLAMANHMTIAAAWSPDGSEIVLGSETMELRHFDGHTGAPLGLMRGHTLGPIMSATYAPDGSVAATGGGDGLVRLWKHGVQVDAIGDGAFRVTSVDYRPDGALFATGGLDIDVWDAHTGTLVGVLPGPRNADDTAVSELHWSPDGTRILALSLSQAPRIWRVAPWRGTVAELSARLTCALRARLDGARLVTAMPDPASCR